MFSVPMLVSYLCASLLCIVTAGQATAVKKVPNGQTSGRYIIKMKDHTSIESLRLMLSSPIVHTFQNVFNGFVVDGPADLDVLLSNPNVESIDEDGIVTIDAIQNDAPWGLARMTSATTFPYASETDLTFQYTYDEMTTPVDVYVMDTGIYIEHNDFGGRAKWGISIDPRYPQEDDNGHGTHCAGTVGGDQFGVAKSATMIAVKVLNYRGRGSVSNVIAGLEWVYNNVASSNFTTPSIVSMSLSGTGTDPLDDAVRSLISSGIHVVVSAGNNDFDAGRLSPARVEEAITVGATNITDFRADFSDFGPVVDVYAPGVNVVSAGRGNPDATAIKTGTSMSTPHVAGFVAYLIGTGVSQLSPAEMSEKLKCLAQKDVLEDIPEDSHNLLLHQ